MTPAQFQHIIALWKEGVINLSVPYSRYIFNLIPWYSFLIVLGVAIAVFLGIREEKYAGFKKDTFLDFALIALPSGIIGARIYYVVFTFENFKDDILSVFRIWEGGIAIYGAIIAGVIAAVLFSIKRKISFWTLCDLAAPGLVLAQAIGRWGNYFNQEAYGLALQNPALCFFPFAVQIHESSGSVWHMATFFYESCWDFGVFVFLMIARRKWFRYRGDVIRFYGFLYACGRLIIEDFRLDSLYASSSARISQLLSVVICASVMIYYIVRFRFQHYSARNLMRAFLYAVLAADVLSVFWMAGLFSPAITLALRCFLLVSVSMLNITAFLLLYAICAEGEVVYANNDR